MPQLVNGDGVQIDLARRRRRQVIEVPEVRIVVERDRAAPGGEAGWLAAPFDGAVKSGVDR